MAEGNCSALSTGKLSTSGCGQLLPRTLTQQLESTTVPAHWQSAEGHTSCAAAKALACWLVHERDCSQHASHKTPTHNQTFTHPHTSAACRHASSTPQQSHQQQSACAAQLSQQPNLYGVYTRQRTPQLHESGDMIMNRVLQPTLAQPIYEPHGAHTSHTHPTAVQQGHNTTQGAIMLNQCALARFPLIWMRASMTHESLHNTLRECIDSLKTCCVLRTVSKGTDRRNPAQPLGKSTLGAVLLWTEQQQTIPT